MNGGIEHPPTWSRTVPQWYNVSDLEWGPAEGLQMGAGLAGRLLSKAEDRTRSATWQVHLPDDWSAQVEPSGTLELFVLEGELRAGATTVGVGGFVGVPAGTAVRLSSPSGALVLVYSNPQLTRDDCYVDGALVVVESRSLPWSVDGAQGVAVKTLRVSEPSGSGRGGFLNLLLFLPGFVSTEVEFHNTWEEMFYLDGDFLMVERGNAGVGTVHANPAGALHGPFGSQFGSLMLHHALESYRTDFDHLPGGLDIVGCYLSKEPFLGSRPETTKWHGAALHTDPTI